MLIKINFIWFFGFFVLLNLFACQRNTMIIINEIPQNEGSNDTLYLAGSINDWQPNAANYQLQPHQDGTYRIQLKDVKTPFEYKITRGSWQTVETTLQGHDIPNRQGEVKRKQTIQVKGWADKYEKVSTKLSNVQLVDDHFPMTQLQSNRQIWIYLPSDYANSTKNYPVLYMHDGQNLFDVLTSFSGEWEVDESMRQLEKEENLELIIVGINNSADRISEYTPYKNEEYGGGKGKEYADFIVNELKPYIDKNYRTKPQREYTGMMGSSLGGVISMYIGTEYSETFSKLGVFSPAFWWSEKCYEQVQQKGFLTNTKIYMNAGLDESPLIVNGTKKMEKTLQSIGYSEKNCSVEYIKGKTHSESFWKEEFPKAVRWLFKE